MTFTNVGLHVCIQDNGVQCGFTLDWPTIMIVSLTSHTGCSSLSSQLDSCAELVLVVVELCVGVSVAVSSTVWLCSLSLAFSMANLSLLLIADEYFLSFSRTLEWSGVDCSEVEILSALLAGASVCTISGFDWSAILYNI